MLFKGQSVCVCVFKKFQDNLNALKSSSDVPSKDEILDQQSQEGRAKEGYELIGVCRAMGCAPALGDGNDVHNPQIAVAASVLNFSLTNITLQNTMRA